MIDRFSGAEAVAVTESVIGFLWAGGCFQSCN